MKGFFRPPIRTCLLTFFSACSPIKMMRTATGGEVSQTAYLSEVPITLVDGLPFIEVEVSGQTYSFLFDTGAEVSALGSHLAGREQFKRVTELTQAERPTLKKKSIFCA